jgi:hypothetical protein
MLVGVPERRRHANCKAQKVSQIERLLSVPSKNAVERLTARVRDYKDHPPFVASERERLGRPHWLKLGCERVFMFKASQTLWQGLFRGRSDD